MSRTAWRTAHAAVLALVLAASSVDGTLSTARAASTFVVASTADEPDASPGDGRCASTPSGGCTLRAAVMEASALGGTSAIDLATTGTYALSIAGQGEDGGAAGDLDINGVDLTIRNTSGGGIAIDGTGPVDAAPPVDLVFDIGPIAPAQVRISGATVQRGGVPDGGGGSESASVRR